MVRRDDEFGGLCFAGGGGGAGCATCSAGPSLREVEAMHWNIRKAVQPTVQDIDLGFRVVLVKARYRPMKVIAGEMVG